MLEDKKSVLEKYKEEAEVHGVLKMGTLKEARKWIGRKMDGYQIEDPVDHVRIKNYCELIEDGNPSYWDEEFARKQWGGIISPPGMLGTFALPARPLWRPEYRKVERQGWLPTQVPLPGDTMINVETDSTFYRPIHLGDRLSCQEEVVEVSEEKKTALGIGHFIITLATWYNQDGEVVAQERNNLFRYRISEE